MNYFLVKLRFTSPVHFGPFDTALSLYTSGMRFCADTLFSALCQTVLVMEGQSGISALCDMVQTGNLLLSDSMPYSGNTLYLPKPCAVSDSKQELPAEQRKAVKKAAWIPGTDLERFCQSIQGGTPYQIRYQPQFGTAQEETKANLRDREHGTLPYPVGTYAFFPGCGLWFIVGCRDKEYFSSIRTLLTALGLSGIGGKISAGYGKFELCEAREIGDTEKWLLQGLKEQANHYLLLTTSLPGEEELDEVLEDAYFQLTRRGGFVQSEKYAEEGRKKQTQYFLSSGSVLKRPFQGKLYDVGGEGKHPVYRYSCPVMLGVRL